MERSGAAQGLAEVLAVMGATHLATLLPDLLANTASKNVFVREGHLTLFQVPAARHARGLPGMTPLPLLFQLYSRSQSAVGPWLSNM